MSKILNISFFACLLVFAACKKNEINVAKFDYTEGQAMLKINFSSPYAAKPGVVLKINGERISNSITYSTPYPGGGLNTGGSSNADYLPIDHGKNTFSIIIPKSGTGLGEDSVVLFTSEINLAANVYQTYHVTDTSANTTGIMLTDLSARPDSGISKFRFINLIPNSKVDLLFGTATLATGIDYKQATDTFYIAAGTVQQFRLRINGSTTNLTTYPTTVSGTYTIPNQRAFTIYSRGYLNATDDNRKPQLSLLFNK